MRRRIAAILLTASIFWKLIEETAWRAISSLNGSKTAELIRMMLREEEEAEEPPAKPPNDNDAGGIDQWIEEAAREYDLDTELIRAIIHVESAGNPNAVSSKGAQGLMQLMPETSRLLGVNDPFDPRDNINGGARYLREMLDRFGQLDLALAAYNAGPGIVERYGRVPPYQETRLYLWQVKKRYAELKQAKP